MDSHIFPCPYLSGIVHFGHTNKFLGSESHRRNVIELFVMLARSFRDSFTTLLSITKDLGVPKLRKKRDRPFYREICMVCNVGNSILMP